MEKKKEKIGWEAARSVYNLNSEAGHCAGCQARCEWTVLIKCDRENFVGHPVSRLGTVIPIYDISFAQPLLNKQCCCNNQFVQSSVYHFVPS